MRIILGYTLIAFSAVLLIALLSFNPMDSAFLASKVNQPLENMAGILGVWISSPLVLLYGKYGSLALNFGFFVIGINFLVGAKIGRIFIKATLFIIATICLSVILAVLMPAATYIESGLFGLAISKSLQEVLHPYIIIGIFSLILLLSLVSAMKLFQQMTYGLARLLGWIVLAPFQMFGLLAKTKEEPVSGREVFAYQGEGRNTQDHPGRNMEKEEKWAERKEPEYLHHTPRKDEGREFVDVASLSREAQKAPLWLIEKKAAGDILSEINQFFDQELGEGEKAISAANISIMDKEIPVEEVSEKKPEEEIIIQKEKPEPELLNESNGLEIEEIVGEADYAELAQSRRSREDIEQELFTEKETHPDYVFPDLNILEKGLESFSRAEENEEIDRVSKIIENTFASFKIDVRVSGHSRGPAITRYEIIPPTGLKLKNIVNLTDDLALNLGTRNIRIVAPIGNKSIVGVEVPNKFRRTVVLREIIESEEYKKTKAKLPLILGKDIAGNIVIEDLTEMPHLLIAGTTGSGKSVYVNSLIGGLTFKKTAEEVKFIFIDPKMVELELYNGIPHLLAPVITSPEEAIAVLEWTSAEMDKRYKMLSDFGVRNMDDYNREVKKIKTAARDDAEKTYEYFPYIVIVIDEFANLMLRLPKETEKVISRIAAMARAVGIHLVVATQRPSVDVVTGIIKANFPSRIAFRVSSQTDSRTILDKSGAEKLLGKGDMLFMTPNFIDMLRIQSPYVSNSDIENLVKDLKRNGKADYVIDVEGLMASPASETDSAFSVDYRDDPLFIESLKAAVENGEISASSLQRRFRIGYNRASRLIEAMDKMGALGPSTGSSKPREVLFGAEELNNFMNRQEKPV